MVDYCAGAALVDCVESLIAEGVARIVVVDNSCQGASAIALGALAGAVDLIEPPVNLGFGAGVNAGASKLGKEDFLVCNADVVFHPGSVAALSRALGASSGRGIVGPKIFDDAGKLYPSARRFPALGDAMGHAFVGLVWGGNPWSRRYTMGEWDHGSEREVDWVSGSAFMVDALAWETLGGFDESYFMYAEDVDLCWRAWRAGWGVVYAPAATVTHIQGISTRRHPWRMLWAHHRSLWRFAERSTTGWQRVLLPLVALGLAGRALAAAARTRLGRDRAGWRGIEGGC